ncbi:patatin-like phospholipase family protein [Thauera linaloolentis]|uniref:Patatin n=1 Tax=Thauera linaloolentis (strain DSM 12138 / JCM 21573 / CCUG 41526 / CIP 105981 / IAM 15112 / NBRC 102519 / 47Lol) TaxID=1123367 RepID=N6Y3I0_THAL4|nr:patatin-like phospholipase family protein [Thauera linaloolentis]ENO86140.1 patatin [Thauera linaloolentis 47Lol = DSM 12138]MCM8564631.1 patatin-like phospholipase family protein [Thauera linaloolentis]
MFRKLLRAERDDPAPPLSLALQGGGAHGAYTWGVLDRLLEDDWRLDGISGTSAGAMNAVALAQGWTTGGAEGARAALEAFWMAVGDSTPFHLDLMHSLNPAQDGGLPAPMNMMLGLARLFSPYQLNPFELNPLRDVVRAQFDFERLRRSCPLKLFIAATTVRTGKVHLFRTRDLSEEALLASACLPTLHRAVEIDGEHYWDGGFTANPAIYPLMYECATPDILLVLLNPLVRDDAPRSAGEIAARSMELGFSTTFLREMRMIAHARSYIGESKGWLPHGRLERKLMRLRFHLIEAKELGDAGGDSKLNASTSFLVQLRDLGRMRADRWLRRYRRHVGRRASVDLEHLFA